MVPRMNRNRIDLSTPETHYRLNRLVLESLPKCGFDAKAIPNEQARRLKLIPNCGAAFHRDWDSLDGDRRTAACRYEWARLQVFLAVEVLPVLQHCNTQFYHVTLADKRWRVEPSYAGKHSFDPPRRKVRAAIQALRDAELAPIYVAAFEISGDRNLAGDYTFEPHAHILIGGVPEPDLKRAFRVRLPRSARGRDKPVKVAQVDGGSLGILLGYLAKIKAEDRVEYERSDGRRDRKSNGMPHPEKIHWLRCMATMPIAHTIQFGGFAEPITTRFTHREMATLIGEI